MALENVSFLKLLLENFSASVRGIHSLRCAETSLRKVYCRRAR